MVLVSRMKENGSCYDLQKVTVDANGRTRLADYNWIVKATEKIKTFE